MRPGMVKSWEHDDPHLSRALPSGVLVTNVKVRTRRPSFEIIPRLGPYLTFICAGNRVRHSILDRQGEGLLSATAAKRNIRITLQGRPWGTRLYTICCPSVSCRPPVSSSSNAFCNTWSLIGLRAAPPTALHTVIGRVALHASAAILWVTQRLPATGEY